MATSPDEHDDDMQAEYDFRSMEGVVRGKYAGRYAEYPRLFRLDPDLVSAFPDDEAVNLALRQFLAEHPRENAG